MSKTLSICQNNIKRDILGKEIHITFMISLCSTTVQYNSFIDFLILVEIA